MCETLNSIEINIDFVSFLCSVLTCAEGHYQNGNLTFGVRSHQFFSIVKSEWELSHSGGSDDNPIWNLFRTIPISVAVTVEHPAD